MAHIVQSPVVDVFLVENIYGQNHRAGKESEKYGLILKYTRAFLFWVFCEDHALVHLGKQGGSWFSAMSLRNVLWCQEMLLVTGLPLVSLSSPQTETTIGCFYYLLKMQQVCFTWSGSYTFCWPPLILWVCSHGFKMVSNPDKILFWMSCAKCSLRWNDRMHIIYYLQ